MLSSLSSPADIKKETSQTTGRLCLSPLAVSETTGERVFLAGPWCLNTHTVELLKRVDLKYELIKTRALSKVEFTREADMCFSLYNKYIRLLTSELNHLHGTNYSERYWNTLLNRFLYPLIASVMDKYFLLEKIKTDYPGLVVDIVDYKENWINPHEVRSFGGSRLLHFLLFSCVADTTSLLPVRVIDNATVRDALERMGDGKKDLKSKRENVSFIREGFAAARKKMKWLFLLKRMLNGEMPIDVFRFTTSKVLALGDQYLERSVLKDLLRKSGSGSFYFNPQEWDVEKFGPRDQELRRKLKFSDSDSLLEKAINEALRIFLPTVYLSNYAKARQIVRRVVPKRKIVILNSQNFSGREFVDFFIAHSVEEQRSHHMMICHGGCFGAMEVSVQDQIWAQISDSYALWSNAKSYGSSCEFLKMPSLRFHKWQSFNKDKPTGSDILLFLTGYYPNRYAYNSIFPYTIDDTYDDWQIRFMSALSEKNRAALILRDYHRSSDISQGNIQAWADERGIRIDASLPITDALRKSKIAIQTVPQTTYLETISADHPTLCFWNPEANMIREDLQPYYDGLVRAGVLHYSPESAAQKLNEIADDPAAWWNSAEVREAITAFKNNVCLTAPDAIDQWARFIAEKS